MGKRQRVPFTKVKRIKGRTAGFFPLRRCETCPYKSKAVIKDKETGVVERVISCRDSCMYFKGGGFYV